MVEDGGVLVIALILFGVVGGLLSSIALGDGLALRPSGLIGSLLGAVLVTVGWTLASGRRAR